MRGHVYFIQSYRCLRGGPTRSVNVLDCTSLALGVSATLPMAMMQVVHALWLLCAIMVMSVAALSYDTNDLRLGVTSFDGGSRLKKSFASASDMPSEPETLTMEPDDVIKLTFYASISSGEKATGELLPHQAWVVMDDKDASRTSIWPLQVRGSSSSASWSMRVDRLSPNLKRKMVEAGPNHPFRLTLILASFAKDSWSTIHPLILPLLDVQFSQSMLNRFESQYPPSARYEAELADGFHPQPFHQHTFQVEPWQTMPPKAVSIGSALIVIVVPWSILLALWRPLFSKTATLSRSASMLIASIWFVEVLAFLHWVSVPVWIVFPAAGAALLTAMLGGRSALSQSWIRSSA